MDLSAIRLIAVDMDGTLLNSAHAVGDDFWGLHTRLIAAGITFAAASGRQADSIIDKLEPIKDTLAVFG